MKTCTSGYLIVLLLLWLSLLILAGVVWVYDSIEDKTWAIVLFSIIAVPVLVLCAAVVIALGVLPGIAFYVYFISHMGWATLLYIAGAFAGAFLLSGIMLSSRKLSRKALLEIFAVPGVIATLIGLVLTGASIMLQ